MEIYFNFVEFMQELIQHIETLLKDHNFVIVPGFGGFVAEVTGATEVDGTLYPPHKSIGFNPTLAYNDGLLAQQYVKAYGMTFDEASAHIRAIVVKIEKNLEQWRHLRIGGIGMFHLTESGLQFEPTLTNNLLSASYGLVPVYFPVIEPVITTPMPETTDLGVEVKGVEFTERKKQGTLFYKIAAAAAILLLLVLFPLNVNDARHTASQVTEQAAFVPHIDTVMPQEALQQQIDSITAPVANATYHIIIGSFYSKSKAMQYLDELPSGYREECSIVLSEHRYRVSYKSFGSETECDTFLETFTTANPRFADAWILEIINN